MVHWERPIHLGLSAVFVGLCTGGGFRALCAYEYNYSGVVGEYLGLFPPIPPNILYSHSQHTVQLVTPTAI